MIANPIALLVFVLVANYTPGPNNILSASMGALYGFRRAVPFLLGVASGFFTLMLVCATLSSFLNAMLPKASPVVRIIGALYILWLAWGIYRNSGKLLSRPEEARPLRFWNGFALQFVNPKAVLFGLTIYSAFLAQLLDNVPVLLLSTLLLALVTLSAISAWTLGGNLVRGWVRTPRRARILGLTLAAALVYTAVDLAFLS